MRDKLLHHITGFLSGSCYFRTPVLGIADGRDPLFGRFSEVVHPDHLDPVEMMRCAGGLIPETVRVVVWLLPVAEDAIEANRLELDFPSRAWAHVRNFGEKENDALCRAVVEWFSDRGVRAVAPRFLEGFSSEYERCSSTWSERHAAYAAGLGTFGLSDALITQYGVTHRLGSVVVDAPLPVDSRPYAGVYDWCPYKAEGKCGACIRRCPTGAITPEGHDKKRCFQYTRDTVYPKCNPEYGVDIAGCGLCMTKVPCEGRRPGGGVRTPSSG